MFVAGFQQILQGSESQGKCLEQVEHEVREWVDIRSYILMIFLII